MKLVTIAEMKEIEKQAEEAGLSYEMMMENAGYNLAQQVMELATPEEPDVEMRVLGLVGSGNNGGDTLVALARLAEKGWTARAYLVKRKAAGDSLVARLENAGGEVFIFDSDSDLLQLRAFVETSDVILDGVLGTGFNLPIKPEIGNVLNLVRNMVEKDENPPLVVAVDCPSGVNSDTGEASEETIPADVTITMAAIKQGLLVPPAYQLAGDIRVVEIGDLSRVKAFSSITNEVADETMVQESLPCRPVDAHKGTFGTALIAAGSLNYTGAALLAGKAAARVGVGLVTLAVPSPLHAALAGHFPEATWILLPHELGVISSVASDVLVKHIDRATALLIGPGLGLEQTTREFLLKAITYQDTRGTKNRRIGFIQPAIHQKPIHTDTGLPPLVIDADGLKLLAQIPEWYSLLPALSILTPHPGEMSILTEKPLAEIQKNRLATARHFAAQWGHVVVLKGAFTVVASPDGHSVVIPVATPALAHAGTGDVLSGLIVGLRAQGVDAFRSAIAGAWIHAQAGNYASEIFGDSACVLAGDILDLISEIMGEIRAL